MSAFFEDGRKNNPYDTDLNFRLSSEPWGIFLFAFNLPFWAMKEFYVSDWGCSFGARLVKAIGAEHFWIESDLLGIHDGAIVVRCPDGQTAVEQMVGEVGMLMEEFTEVRAEREKLQKDTRRLMKNIRCRFNSSYPNLSNTLKGMPSLDGHCPKLKPPMIFNFSFDLLLPLYVKPEYKAKLELGNKIVCFMFIRLDPRVASGLILQECSYDVGARQFETLRKQLLGIRESVAAVFAGVGLYQVVILLTTSDFQELGLVRREIRQKMRLPRSQRWPLYPVSTSSSLIAVPTESYMKTYGQSRPSNVSFSILLKVWSGYDAEDGWRFLSDLAEVFGITVTTTIGVTDLNTKNWINERQGHFDVILSINDYPNLQVLVDFIDVLNTCVSFIEDAATIVRAGPSTVSGGGE
jgi:hypothetical protein